jgi:cyclophilin family peptidyl-prolyl cis-trans isomerase
MGTDKRARQKANRAARIEAAYETQRKEEARKRGTTAVVAVAVLAALIGIYLFATKDDDGELATGDTGGPASTLAGSVAGQPCVALADPLPAGAPEVPVPEGPAPAELIVEDLSEGDGEVIEAGATIKANYIGVACSTGKIFDDSYSKGAPIEFPLTGVVAGWSEGIPGMKVGGRRLLVIPPDKGYGDASPDPNIAPGETLVFVVEPTEVVSGGETTGGPATVPAPGPGASLTGDTPCPPAEGAERTTSFETAPPMCLTEGKSYSATFVTNKGDITVELDTERMPATSNNFVVLARYGYYDGTAIFRTDDSIDILQGGSPSTNSPGDPGPGYTVEDEGGEFDFGGDTGGTGPFTYTEGQLVMARSAGPNSSGAQFFLTAGPKVSALDAQGTYLVFGNVTAGLDIVTSILALHVPCADGDPSCIGGGPSEAITIDKVTITES